MNSLKVSTAADRIRLWLDDRHFRRFVKNVGILLSGNLATAAFDLVSLALTARALGPKLFGILVLIHTYITVLDSIANFQSWQAVTKYGADALVQKRSKDFKSLIKFSSALDLSTALLATIVAVGGVYWFSPLWGLSRQTVQMTIFYSLVIAFNLASTPTAILRLFDRFDLLAAQRAGAAAFKLICVGIAFMAGAGLWAFLLTWMLTNILGYLTLFALGWHELRRQGYRGILAANLRGISRMYPGVWRFVGSTNLSSSIRLGAEKVDVLIVGTLLGAAAAGIYGVAKQFGRIPGQLGQPIQQTAYPDMAKLWAEGALDKFRLYILHIGILSGLGGFCIWICFFIAGNWFLNVAVGPEYGDAYHLILVYMLGYVIYLFGVTFMPAVLSMLHPERILSVYIGGHIVFFAVLFLLLDRMGLMGASIAQVTFHAVWFIAMALSIARFLREGVRQSLIQRLA